MRRKLICKEEIKSWLPALNNRAGDVVVRWSMALFGLDKVNAVYDRCKMYEGVEFCEHVLDDIGVNILAENAEVIDRFRGMPFITVSNHPYGHIDALGIISVVGKARPDYKVTANFILSLIDTMSDHFIRVNPYEKRNLVAGAASARNCLNHVAEGNALGTFPAGAVSRPRFTSHGIRICDGKWKPATVKMIRKADVPVIPIWVSGKNSWIYNFLGIFGITPRSIRLPHELFNKRGHTVTIRFGEPVMPEELADMNSAPELAEFLKARVYAISPKK